MSAPAIEPNPVTPVERAPVALERDLGDRGEARRLRSLDWIAQPRVAIPLLLLFGGLIFLVNLGGYPIYTTGEPREAIRIADVVHGGGFILPTQAGIGLPWKPPLMYWLGALVSKLAGRVDEWTVRLPSAILAVGGVLVCYLYLGCLFDRRIALVAALMLATSFEYLQAGSAARVDMTLTFFMEVAFFEFLMIAEGLTARRMLLYAAIAAAILAKGPIGVFLPAAVALIWMVAERRLNLLKDLRLLRGAALVTIVAGGWYLAASFVGGMDFVRRQLLDENLYRLVSSDAVQEPHVHPFYYMELALMAGFLPWSALMPLSIVEFIGRPRKMSPRLKYLIVWFLTVLVFYNLPRSKRGVYLLALYPALAALTALVLTRSYPKRADSLMRGLQRAGGLFLTAIAAVALPAEILAIGPGSFIVTAILKSIGIDNAGFVPALAAAIAARPAASVLLPIVAGAAGVYLLRSTAMAERLFAGALVGQCCIVLAAHLVVVPAIGNALTLKQFTLKLTEIAEGKRLSYLEDVNFDVAFYSPRSIQVVALSQAEGSDYLLCSRRLYDLQTDAFRRRFVSVLESGPTNFKGSGQMLLLRRADPDGSRAPGRSI
jgi:4-amino-4-deoxy-L-arabinose transferase-like glycosyltransferase